LPDLRSEDVIAFDTETRDPDLKTHGPGFISGRGRLLGVSVATWRWKGYIPLYHYEDNVEDVEQAKRWLRHTFSGSGVKLAANIHYDLDALKSQDISVEGDYYDVQVADSLINEEAESYSLDAIGLRRTGEGKDDTLLRQVLSDHRLSMSDMHQLSASYVAEYAVRDADLLLGIYDSQMEDIDKWDLHKALETEVALTRVLWKMHQRGIRIDVDKAERTSEEWRRRAQDHLQRALRASRIRFNPDSSKSLAKLLADRGVAIPTTAKGNPSISNDYLKGLNDPVLNDVYQYRRLNKIRRDFIDGVFLKYAHRGRIHPQWFQSRSSGEFDAAKGARSGRITGQKPNLTQIPSRDEELGPLTRSIVLPEEDARYCKCDYSSQEPRLLLHYAYVMKCTGAAEARQLYIEDKTTDYHQMTRDMIQARSGVDIIRRHAKTINLGLAYGMGKPKLAGQLGVGPEMAEILFKAYHKGVPYTQEIARLFSDRANEQGYIRTLGGRIRRFSLWESTVYEQRGLFESRERCLQTYGSARRAMTHKALNAGVQGSAADQMKRAIILLDSLGMTPLLQVYDECGFSVGSDKEAKLVAEVMEQAIPTEVPMLVEPTLAANWGDCKG
jgi:DNA polymerase I